MTTMVKVSKIQSSVTRQSTPLPRPGIIESGGNNMIEDIAPVTMRGTNMCWWYEKVLQQDPFHAVTSLAVENTT